MSIAVNIVGWIILILSILVFEDHSIPEQVGLVIAMGFFIAGLFLGIRETSK